MTRTSKWIVTSLVVLASLPITLVVGCKYGEDGKPEEVKYQTTDVLPFFASGSTFIAPLINRWAADYEKTHKVHVNYHPIGSGGGIKNLREGTGAFAASDAPLSDGDLKGMPEILQIPVTTGPVCVIYNVPGLGSQLKLTGKTLAGIFAGEIISWQDPAIGRDNPGMKLANDLRTPIVDPPASAKGAYPITGLSFILIPKDNTHGRGEQQALRDFLGYSLSTGQDVAEQLSYTKLPPPVQQQGEALLAQLTESGKPTK